MCTIRTLILLLVIALFAQAQSGIITGKVTDTPGAAVPNAGVMITTPDGAISQRVVTGQDGTFSATLAPGTYRVEIAKDGFKPSGRNIDVSTSPSTVTITIETASRSETIEVMGTSPAVQMVGADTGAGLNSRKVRELPVADRNEQELTGLLPSRRRSRESQPFGIPTVTVFTA